MKRRSPNQNRLSTLNRRSALKLAGGAGAAALAGSRGMTTATLAQATPEVAGADYPVLLEQGPVTIYDYGLDLPTDDVTFRWADHQGVRVPFHQELQAAYMEAHPNITIEYDSLGGDLAELLIVGVQSGDAHDVMPTNAGFPIAQGVAEGWLAPLDDVVPDFDRWRAAFPENTFLPGINVFDGKTYTCPMYASKLHRQLFFYNKELLAEAGYDPESTPLTWEEYRDAARKVTEQTGSDSYGVLTAGDPNGYYISTMAEIAGANGGEFNWQTGDYNYTSDEFLAAIDLMFAMKDDGSFLPGMSSLTGTDVRARFPDGLAAMWFSGIWNVSIWEEAAPEFDFGVASVPAPDNVDPLPFGITPGIGESYTLYSGSDFKSIAGSLFAFVGSVEGNVALKEISKAVNPVAFPEANEIVEHSPRGERALELNAEQLRLVPHPAVRSLGATQVEMEMRPVTPSLNDVIAGLFTGQLENPQQVMQDLQDRSNAELDRAIQAAQDDGAEISRDDWVFPNWDPREDYGLEDYEGL